MATSIFYKFLYICIAVLGLSAVVCIHELGHFSFCKIFGVATPVFSIGFGPELVQKEIGSTIFTISALPLGGYVAIKGMDNREFYIRSPDSFNAKPYWQKLLILLGGILFNLIFGFGALKIFSKNTQSTIFSDGNSGLIGPIGILQMIANSASIGWEDFMFMLAILSINLGILNLLPLPIFDGGQVVLTTIEAIKGSPIATATKETIQSVSWMLLTLFILYITTKDIFRLSK